MKKILLLLILLLSGCSTLGSFHANASVGWSDVNVDTKSVVESNSKNDGVEA